MSPIPRTNDAEAARGALIERVVREVIARLHEGTASGHKTSERNPADSAALTHSPSVHAPSPDNPTRVTDRVVTAATVAALPSSTHRVEVTSNAVVTPAARDEARERGITVIRGWNVPPNSSSTKTSISPATSVTPNAAVSDTSVPDGTATPQTGLRDRERPERAEAVRAQLERRGVTFGKHPTIVLSDHPAAATHEEATGGRRVATVRRLSDVDRFAAELGPECWVLDMIDLSPVAAVNVARRILQTASHSQSAR